MDKFTRDELIGWGMVCLAAGAVIFGATVYGIHSYNRRRVAENGQRLQHERYIMQHPEEHAMFKRLGDVQELVKSVDHKNDTIRNLSQEISSLNQRNTELNEQVVKLTNRISVRDARIKELEADASAVVETVLDSDMAQTISEAISDLCCSDYEKAKLLDKLIDKL